MGLEQSIQRQKMEYLSDNLLSAVAAVVIGVLIVTWVFLGIVADTLLYGWLTLALLISAVRLWSYFHIKARLSDPQHYPAIERLMIITATMTGLLWGVGSILFCISTEMFYWVFLAFVLSGYASGSVFTTSVSLPACAGYFFPTILPITGWFFLQDDPRAPMMGILLLVFTAAAWNVARNSRRMLLQGYSLIAEKAELSDSLEERNQQLSREVSEHRQTSAALMKSEQSYRQLIEHAPVGILVVKQGKLMFSNHYWHTLMQSSADPSDNDKQIEQLACSSDRHHLSELFKADKQNGTAVPIVWSTPVCTRLHTEVSALPIRFNEEESTLLLITEIESRIKAEQAELHKQQSEAFAQRLEALQTMAGGIAHDFNNVLAAIMGNASLAMSRYAVKQSGLGHFLSNIEVSGERAALLCRQMLAYSGHGAFVVEPLNLSQWIQAHLHKLGEMTEKHVEIRYTLADPLPCMDADPRQIQQLVENLLSNAVEAYQGQSGTIRITTATQQIEADEKCKSGLNSLSPGQYVSLCIQDKGCGMSANTLKNVFDPFFTTKFAGRGLGMSAVFGIVGGLNGDLRINSHEGHGTDIQILIPASSEHAITFKHADASVKQDKTLQDGDLVLLVDDDKMLREAGSMILESIGFQAITACDGLEALEIYERQMHEVKLVILDMTMPRMGGKACLHELRAMNPHLRVIISSGYSMEDMAVQLGDCKPSGMLQKPYTPDMMQQTIFAIE
ncbi:MAG: response regulator [Mariprofundus sp.]|nr:response regulator [Mariprofundus sp.]